MATFNIHVENALYFEIDLEDTPVPPNSNLLDQVYMQDGFGNAVPTLTLRLLDSAGTLQNEMNLVEGLKCNVRVVRRSGDDSIKDRSFRLWGVRREVTGDGNHLNVTFIYNCPNWVAGAVCENYRSPSSAAMATMAGKGGLEYDGPDGDTDDSMNWLNLNMSRSQFAEEMSVRAYGGKTACMKHVVTLEGRVRYKNLFEQIQKDPVASLLNNDNGESASGLLVPIREMSDTSGTGIGAHWLNYGVKKFSHNLEGQGLVESGEFTAPSMGGELTFNDEVKGMVKQARVLYEGFDPGTEPKDASNLHKHYDAALVQNLKGLMLFSERIRVLTDDWTSIETFDSVEYVQNDQSGPDFVRNKAFSGPWLVVGKSIRIKNGHVYSEVFDLARPYTYKGGSAGGSAGGAGSQASANSGPSLTEDSPLVNPLVESPVDAANEEEIANANPLTGLDKHINLVDSLDDFNTAVPSIPSEPVGGPNSISATSALGTSQKDLSKAIDDLKSDPIVGDSLGTAGDGFNPEKTYTIKKIDATTLEETAQAAVSAMQHNPEDASAITNGLESDNPFVRDTAKNVEKVALDRFVQGDKGVESVLNKELESVVTPTTAQDFDVGEFVGDLLDGGVFADDFRSKGQAVPAVAKIIEAADQDKKLGVNFLIPSSKLGIGANDIKIKPREVVELLLDFYEGDGSSPDKLLETQGSDAYRDMFGTRPPKDSEAAIKQLVPRLKKLMTDYGSDEVIAGVTGTEKAAKVVTSLAGAVGLDIPGLHNERFPLPSSAVAQPFKFKYGNADFIPILEKVVKKERLNSNELADVVTTVRETVSWGTLTRMGTNKASETQSGKKWEFPHVDPFTPFVEGIGEGFGLSNGKKV